MCFGSHFSKRQARCLSAMPRVNTTPKRLRSNARRRSLSQRPVVSPTAIRKLCVDMLRGYLASYQLPTTGSKQQLVERLTNHIRASAAKKVQRSRSHPSKQIKTRGKKAAENTQNEAPPLDPTPSESSDSGSCLLYTSPSPRDATLSRMPSSA